MAAARIPPHDNNSEAALLGACMLSKDAMDVALRLLGPTDFYSPAHQVIFLAMQDLWDGGNPLDPVTIANALKKSGDLERIGGAGTLLTIQTGTPSTTNAHRYATAIVDMATYRKAIEIASEVLERAYDTNGDPADIMEQAKDAFAKSGVRVGGLPEDLWVLDDYLNRPDSERPEWCVRDMIRVGWRIIVVACEGVGKTVLFRQIAIAAAQGIHPLDFTPMPPCRTLIVDLENPDDSVMSVCTPIQERVMSNTTVTYDSDRAWLWHRPSGINLRNRADRMALESVIAHVRPDLVCLGPLYKVYEVNARESDEVAAREVMRVFDDLRTRYKFGLLLEHHAPKESAGSKRKMMPYGTSLWLRWPEVGLGLTVEGDGMETLAVGRWRGDRLDNSWPVKLHRSLTWPWQGQYETGHFSRPTHASPPTPRPTDLDDWEPPSREPSRGPDDDEDDGFEEPLELF